MRQDHRIAVIIPVLNEAQAIGRVLNEVPAWVDDIVVADNGSIDCTPEVARQHGARVVFAERRGYGSACLAGMAALLEPDVVVFLDGDYSDYPAEMNRLVDPIVAGEADLVIGSRVLGRAERGALTPQARFGNWLACRLMSLFWGAKHTDLGPFRAIRFAALQRLRMSDPDFGWTVEMQVKAARAGLRVLEAPVSYRHRIGVSKISRTLNGSIRAGIKILSVIIRSALTRYPATKSSHERLIVFTRFPEVGQVKTRLIPYLGEKVAADLHEQMTEYTLQWVRVLRDIRGVEIEIRFTGGDPDRMRERFGEDFDYASQGSGDLGERMSRAVHDAFATGAQAVVLVGTDCPELSADLVQCAFDKLQENDLVLGPAADGGYYLLGQRRFIPALFEGIDWSTPRVLPETLNRAASARLSLSMLRELRDVDKATDLEVWNAVARPGQAAESSTLSVIIPTLNESENVDALLELLGQSAEVERIVVDGASTDDTVARAMRHNVQVVHAPRGRAAQMNAGAAVARGEGLVFLHADTRLRAAHLNAIRAALADPRCVGGAFTARIDSPRWSMRLISWGINLRTRLLQLPYGDQCLFVRTSVFRGLGGYRPISLLEDTDLVRRLRRKGNFMIMRDSVLVTDRHWQPGVVRTTLVNWLIAALFTAGMSPERLWRIRQRLLPSNTDSRPKRANRWPSPTEDPAIAQLEAAHPERAVG